MTELRQPFPLQSCAVAEYCPEHTVICQPDEIRVVDKTETAFKLLKKTKNKPQDPQQNKAS